MTGHLAASEVNPASNGQSRLQQFANCVEQNRLDTKIHQLAEAYDMPAAGGPGKSLIVAHSSPVVGLEWGLK